MKAQKLISWNVNGLRAVMKKGFEQWLKAEAPDVLCLQEVRAMPDQVDLSAMGYHVYWNAAEKKGYSGTAILSRSEPISIVTGMTLDNYDQEGRVLTAEYPDWYLVNVYTPNAQRELTRLGFRIEWDQEFLSYLLKLSKRKPVIATGDLNVAHQEIDLAHPGPNRGNSGFTDQERQGFQKFLDNGFVDSFREFEKGPGHYSWWTARMNARAKNVGWRIDYFLVAKALRQRLRKAWIMKDVMGSDHAPVAIEID
jgi:exodeoxyribonuclease-3